MQHAQQGWGQLRGAGIAGELSLSQSHSRPSAPLLSPVSSRPSSQPSRVSRFSPSRLPSAQNTLTGRCPSPSARRSQPGTGEERQQDQRKRAQAGALTPVPERLDEPVTVRQPERAALDQRRQIAALGTGLAVGLVVVQRPGMLFAQAHGFRSARFGRAGEIGRGRTVAASRWRVEP